MHCSSYLILLVLVLWKESGCHLYVMLQSCFIKTGWRERRRQNMNGARSVTIFVQKKFVHWKKKKNYWHWPEYVYRIGIFCNLSCSFLHTITQKSGVCRMSMPSKCKTWQIHGDEQSWQRSFYLDLSPGLTNRTLFLGARKIQSCHQCHKNKSRIFVTSCYFLWHFPT